MLWAPRVVALTASDRWLGSFSVAALLVVVGAIALRRGARALRERDQSRQPAFRARRRAGALVALGPLVGLLFAPEADKLAIVAAIGALLLAVFGLVSERLAQPERATLLVVAVAAAAAVATGARFGPTGVVVVDVLLAWAFIVLVTEAADGLGDSDGLACGVGAVAAFGVFALAGFAGDRPVAGVAAGLSGACIGFLAFNFRPASLFIGKGGRLAIGYALAVSALAVRTSATPAGAAGRLIVPVMLVGVLVVDGTVVVWGRLRRGRKVTAPRNDHLVHRLTVLGMTRGEASVLFIVVQLALSAIALFTARGVLPLWLGLAAAAAIVAALVGNAARGHIDHRRPVRLGGAARIGLLLIFVVLVAAVLPVAFTVNDSADLMNRGRTAATRALTAARDGDAILASGFFRQAARTFTRAANKLESPILTGGMAIPALAPNLGAARELARIGTDLARAGEDITTAVRPEALEVLEGRIPLEEVRRLTPKLEAGSQALSQALDRIREVDDPYILAPVRDAIDKVERQLAHTDGEARRGVAAARLAPAILGGEGVRHYLLVVQNNAESRATGGFIGSFGILTAQDGKVSVGRIERTRVWNEAVNRSPDPTAEAPSDYHERYDQFEPVRTLQNVNLSPDFPSVASVLMSLAPQAGIGPVDGVLAVDPFGLAALLELTGPVSVEGWPTPIDSSNAVDVTLRDAYSFFERTPERAEFLGDVAQAVVDEATTGSLGRPAQIARVLGSAAHEGHLIVALARPAEQKLARQLGVAGRVAAPRSDAVAVTTSNIAANKIDFYLQRNVNYRVQLDPDPEHGLARASGRLAVQLDNTAPAQGLPQIVIGPYIPDRFQAGENRAYVSLYSPLGINDATLDGEPVDVSSGRERGTNVYSAVASVPAHTAQMLTADLGGVVRLRRGGWYELEVRHQPTVRPDRLHVAIQVPEGWRIAEAPDLRRVSAQEATRTINQEGPVRLRVRIVREASPWDLWGRLDAGG